MIKGPLNQAIEAGSINAITLARITQTGKREVNLLNIITTKLPDKLIPRSGKLATYEPLTGNNRQCSLKK